MPTSAVEDADGPTTRGPAWKHHRDTVNRSASASIPSDQGRSCHQGDFTPTLKFGGEIIKTDVRADKNQMDRDGHTSLDLALMHYPLGGSTATISVL